MAWLRFVFAGLCFALVVEIFYKFFAGLNPKAFLISIVFYVLYLQPLYLLHNLLNRFFGNSKLSHIGYFFLTGLIGLIALEWGLVGNTPKGNPNASQVGMFIFHATYPAMARLFSDRSDVSRCIQKSIKKYYFGFIVLCIAGVLIPNEFFRFVWFIYFPLFGSIGLCYFYWRYVTKSFKDQEVSSETF